jgi:hypothetical protein
VLNSTHVTLDPLPRTITYCKISNIPGQSNKPDELTSVIKTKFYHHLVSIDSNILEALSRKHLALQRSYFLLLDSQIPGPSPVKPFNDLCTAAKKLLPGKAALTLATPMNDFQAFLEPTLPNSVLGTQAFSELESLLNTLCNKDKNKPIVLQILHGLQAMNLNIQAHFVSFAKHKQSSHKMVLPSPLPLLFSPQSTAADIYQSYYNILRTDLAVEDLKFLYIVTENEKTYMLQWVRDLFQRITAIPTSIPIHTMNQDQLPPKSTIYHNHVELKSKSPGRKNNMVNNDPNITPVTTTLSPPIIDINDNISDDLPIIDVTFLHSQTIPSHLRQTSFRAKRNSVTDFFADITGLAPYDQVEKLQRNEEQIQKVQEETTKEVKTILSQTNAIVDSLKEQSDKLATLYKDETSVKSALSTLLQDENNIMSQLAKIAASLEVMTDVSTAFMVFHSTMNLIPYMLQDIEDCILAIATQSFYPSLVPEEEIRHLIPIHAKASLLAISIIASLTASSYFLDIQIPEFYPAFQVSQVSTIPYYSVIDKYTAVYTSYNLAEPFVAVNSQMDVFTFNSEDCTRRNSITVCPPYFIKIRTSPATCAQQIIMALDQPDICKVTSQISSLQFQSYIYLDNYKQVRIFSPKIDSLSFICGSKVSQNTTELNAGWTDVKFQPDCYIATSQLKIYSPVLPSDDTQLEETTTIPDLSTVMDEIEEYMQTNHQINMTALFADFSKLQESINIETMDVKSVQDTLKKVNIMKDLDNFNPTQLHLEKLSHLSTWTAVLFWLIAALAVVATCCCCYCLCPACCGQCITCLCTSLCKCIPLSKVPKRIANPMRAFSTNVYDTPVHYQSEMSQIHMPQRASAPIEGTQVNHTRNPNNNGIDLIEFKTTPTPVSYPTLPKSEWEVDIQSDRSTLTCGSVYYCVHDSKCFNEDGSIARISSPTPEQIQRVRDSQPPKIIAKYDEKCQTYHWHLPDNDIRIWKAPHWYSEKVKRSYCGYGEPVTNSAPTKN